MAIIKSGVEDWQGEIPQPKAKPSYIEGTKLVVLSADRFHISEDEFTNVEVHVDKPIVLVLASTKQVDWLVNAGPDTNIVKVLLHIGAREVSVSGVDLSLVSRCDIRRSIIPDGNRVNGELKFEVEALLRLRISHYLGGSRFSEMIFDSCPLVKLHSPRPSPRASRR